MYLIYAFSFVCILLSMILLIVALVFCSTEAFFVGMFICCLGSGLHLKFGDRLTDESYIDETLRE